MPGRSARRGWVDAVAVFSLAISCGSVASADEPPPATDDKRARPPAESKPAPLEITESGGRLVITGVAVDVVAPSDFRTPNTSIATKTDTPLLEVPQSVTVVDRDLLDDMQANNIAQAHDYAAGLTPQDETGAAFSRGFPIGFYDLRRDGLRTYSWSICEPAALDRIQYLRGPTGLLYGDGNPGGLVNLVLKKPLPMARYEVSAGGGGLGYRRLTADATGPLTSDRRLRYRLVAAGEELGDGYDNDESRVSVLPMASWEISPSTTLQVDGEYYRQHGRGYRHLVPVTPAGMRGDLSGLPWDLNVASPDDGWTAWNASGGVRLDTRLSTSTSLHVSGRYTKIAVRASFQNVAGLQPDGHTLARNIYGQDSDWDETHGDAFVEAAARTGPVRHRLVAGTEVGVSSNDTAIGLGPAPSIDLFAPVYAPRPPAPVMPASATKAVRLGLYVQDQATFGEKMILVAGVRLGRVRTEPITAHDGTRRPDPPVVDDALTPRLGLVYRPRPWLSVYGGYNRGFEPSAPGRLVEGGRPLEAADSESFEGGLKATAGSRLSLTATAFRIRQTNVPELQPLGGFYLQIGEGRSRGVELEAIGRVAPGLAVVSGFAVTRTEITRDIAGFAGRELPNAPREKANVWLRYAPAFPALRRLTLSAGVVHVGHRFVTRDNAVRLPPYTRLDAGLTVAMAGQKALLSLSAQNLTDLRYVTSGTTLAYWAGAPRRLAATVTSRF
jgi:iron complex outermembrane recepter protein